VTAMPLHLMQHPQELVVVRLPAGAEAPFDWTRGPIGSLTRTGEETSIICRADVVPSGMAGARVEGPFRAVEVAGPLAFDAVGVFVEILTPLARAGIAILGVSTYDTDWVLVPAGRFRDAADAWRSAGLILTPAVLTGGGD
jgi:hypothetical protein